ncbi:FtsK/SpoIIIE domain-containing protein [Streptomyces altiplanensis]
MPPTKEPMLLSVPVALRSDGAVHARNFRTIPHELVMGTTESGKSVYLRGLVKGLVPQAVALVGIDCKWGAGRLRSPRGCRPWRARLRKPRTCSTLWCRR